ncbi:unnamed protein product [Calypogeia fissa]
MADLENVKIVDEEKQQPVLASAAEQQKSDERKKPLANGDNVARVVLVLLLILNFVQWRYSMIPRDPSKSDKCLQKENIALKLQDQVRGLCLDRAALMKSVEEANKLATLHKLATLSNSGDEALHALEDFLSMTTIESEAISEALKKVEMVLAEQNELLHERAMTQQSVSQALPQQDLQSVCDMLAV